MNAPGRPTVVSRQGTGCSRERIPIRTVRVVRSYWPRDDGQLMGGVKVTGVVRWIPWLSVRCGTRVAQSARTTWLTSGGNGSQPGPEGQAGPRLPTASLASRRRWRGSCRGEGRRRSMWAGYSWCRRSKGQAIMIDSDDDTAEAVGGSWRPHEQGSCASSAQRIRPTRPEGPSSKLRIRSSPPAIEGHGPREHAPSGALASVAG
jgi:hypothetical protein